MEFPDLELERLKKELSEYKAKVEKYAAILKENDLLDEVPAVSVIEDICLSQLEKYNNACQKGAVLTLEEVKIVDFLCKNLMLARGKTPPAEKKGKKGVHDKLDIGKLLRIAEGNDE